MKQKNDIDMIILIIITLIITYKNTIDPELFNRIENKLAATTVVEVAK